MRMIARRGQSVTEYAIVFTVVAAAIFGMQVYLKRGLQAKQRDATAYFTGVTGNPLGTGGDITTKSQYEPYYAESNYLTNQDSSITEEVGGAMGLVNRNVSFENTARTGVQRSSVNMIVDDTWN